MLPLSIEGDSVGTWRQARVVTKLREQVTHLFEESRDDVYRYLLTLGLYPPQAQEATQEVFLRLYTALRKGDEIRKPRAWIFRVAHNLGIDIRTRQDTELPYAPELDFRHAAQHSNPEQQLAERERTMRFHRAMEGLSEQQRRCLFLRMEGLRYAEIAEALGISSSAVGEFLRRAIERLRRSS